MVAHIEIIIGPMFSGKTTELIRRCSTYESINFNILIFNHTYDTRCSNKIQNHQGLYKNAIKTNSLVNFYNQNITIFNNINVIAIDEAQFFDDLLQFVQIIETYNITLIISGLDGDANRQPFGQILQCIPYANSVTKLNAMCMIKKDGTLAPFSKKIIQNNSTSQIDVGNNDKYISVSREAYLSGSIP